MKTLHPHVPLSQRWFQVVVFGLVLTACAVLGTARMDDGGGRIESNFAGFRAVKVIPGAEHRPVPAVRAGDVGAAAVVGGVILERELIDVSSIAKNGDAVAVSLRPDGNVLLTLGDKNFVGRGEPWMLVPMVNVVESGQVSLVSLLGKPNKQEATWRKELQLTRKDVAAVFFVEMHPKLLHSMLGMQLLLADMALVKVGGDSFSDVQNIQSDFDTQLGVGWRDRAIEPPVESKIVFWNPNWGSAADQPVWRAIRSARTDGYIITDTDVQYLVSPYQNGDLLAKGAPAHSFWRRRGGEIEFNDELNAEMRSSGWAIMSQAQETWDTTRRAGWWLAMFREVKARTPVSWKQFVEDVGKLPKPREVETPRAWVVHKR